MATKSKSTKSSGRTSSAEKSTSAKSRSRKRSAPRGKKRPVPHNPFAPGTKVGVYHAYEVGPQRDIRDAPLGKPITTVTAKDDGTVEFNVKDPGNYALAAEGADGKYDYQIVTVK